MLRLAPLVVVGLLSGPVLAGLLGVLLPAFGYLPAIGGNEPSLEPWRMLLGEPGLFRSVLVSFVAGLATAAVALTVTLLFIAGSHGSPAFRWMRRLISPLLSVPHAAAALGFAFLVAPSGLVSRLLSPWATGWQRPPDALIVHDAWGLTMMAGLTAKEIPFLLLMSLAALPQVRPAERMAIARSLGYGPVTGWLKVVLPALYPLIRLPVYAVIAYASSVVDVALILGPTNPPTLSVAIVKLLNDPDLSRRFVASAGAILQLAVTLAALAVWWIGERLVQRLSASWLIDGRRSSFDRPLAAAGFVGMTAAAASSLVGIAGMALWSLAGAWRFPAALPSSLTLMHWSGQWSMLAAPLATTVTVGLVSTAISLVAVIAALENELRLGRRAGRVAMALIYLPLVVPPVAFLFGLVVAAQWAGAAGGFWPVVFGHIVFVLPYVYLSLSESYHRLDPRWTSVAKTLGASPWRTFVAVRLPILLAPCLTAAAVGFSVSVGQYLVTQLLGAGRVPTITTEAVALSTGGDRRIIGVWALMQAALPALAFAVAIIVPRVLWRHRAGLRGTH